MPTTKKKLIQLHWDGGADESFTQEPLADDASLAQRLRGSEAEQLRAMGCTADEAIGLSGVILYGKWINRSQRPDIGYGDSLCALKTYRVLASGGHFANERFYGKCHWCGQKGHRESDCQAKARGDARI